MMSAIRSAWTICSRSPATLTSASSRSTCGPSTVRSADLVDRHQLVEQRLDLLDHLLGAAGHDVDAREMLDVVDLGYGQAVDVVAAAREQADHAGEHARLVVDQHGDRVALLLLRHLMSC